MKKLIPILFLLLSLGGNAQEVSNPDTVFNMVYYQSYYSYDHKCPSYVIYKLYKPTSNVKRKNLSFKEYNGFKHFYYPRTKYDRGHLFSAESAASSKSSMESTFYYINCFPQEQRCNRGSWKKYEILERKYAMNDSIIVICGTSDFPNNNSLVPASCFKIIYSLSSGNWLESILFQNDSTMNYRTCRRLIDIFPYSVVKEKYNKTILKPSDLPPVSK